MEDIKNPGGSLSTKLWPWLEYAIQITDRQKFVKFWKNAFRDLKHDLKSARWLRGFGWFTGLIWLLGLLGTLTYISIATLNSTHSACQPDGSFRLHPETYSLWSSSGFFQITLGGGELTFAEAKLVDIVWDIGVGRGGQFLLSLISWHVFKRYLRVCMEVQPVTYQLFRAIFLENEASLPSTWGTIKSFVWQRRFRSKVAMVFMVVTMLFILLFPTLASAMSGYDANVDSYVPDSNQNLIPFRNYSRVVYVIHDGWRIKQDGNYWIIDNGTPSSSDPVLSNYRSCTEPGNIDYISACGEQLAISDYVKQYGLGGKKNESSFLSMPNLTRSFTTYDNYTLPAPVLKISAFTTDDKGLGGANSSEILDLSWMRGNETVNEEWVRGKGSCQTIGNYQWGFSFLQLFVCLVLLILWTIGIYTMWLRAHFTMALRKHHPDDISGEHRAALELVAAMQTELDIYDIEPCMLREKDLRERVNKELKGGTISYAYEKSELQTYSMRKQLKNWFKREKWWFAAIFVTSILCGTVWMSDVIFAFWVISLWIGLVFAMCLGMTNGSRALITLFCSLVSAIIVSSIGGQASATATAN